MEVLKLMLKNTPPGCFSGKVEKMVGFFFLFLSQKERRKEKSSCQKEFRVLRVQFSRAELATGDSEHLRCSPLAPRHFRESGQSF